MAKKRKAARPAKKAARRTARTAKSSARRAPAGARAALSTATDASKSVAARVAAIAQMPTQVYGDDDTTVDALLTVLRDTNEAEAVRLEALQTLQAASFSVVAFEPHRPAYVAALRDVMDDPTSDELRQRVLGMLARDKDRVAQKALLKGLKDPSKALVSPEKALQLLSYDVHADAYAVARTIASEPPNPTARREALRLLAADATAAPMFEKILLDKQESAEIRRISASALQALKPEALQAHARELVLDSSEDEEVQEASLTALTQFGDRSAVAADATLMKQVDQLSDAGSAKVKQGARRFLSKYRE